MISNPEVEQLLSYDFVQHLSLDGSPVYKVRRGGQYFVAKRTNALERKIHQQVTHPGVPQVYGFGRIKSKKREYKATYTILDYVDAPTIAQSKRADGAHDKQTIVTAGISYAQVLTELLPKEIVHGDISVHNLLIRDECRR